MPTTFGWLHFTDLHRGTTSQKAWWSDWVEKLFSDLRARHRLTGPWDLVLFTGDLTDRGTAAQFEQLDGFLAKLWGLFEELQPGIPVGLLAVPGNHDLRRPDTAKNAEDADFDAELTILSDWAKHPSKHDKFWSDASSRYRRVIDRAFADYRAWWDRQAFGKHPGLTHRPGILPGDFAATLEKDGARLGVVGLNSAFLQLTGGHYKERLALGYQQLEGACGRPGPEWAKEHHLCLLLTHHPADWLSEVGRQELGLIRGDRFALHLHGHMHETEYRAQSVGGGPLKRTYQGVSLFGEESWEGGKVERRFGYAIGRLELREDTAALRIWPRKAQPVRHDGGWGFVIDTDHLTFDPLDQTATPLEIIPLPRKLLASGAPPPSEPPPREGQSDARHEGHQHATPLEINPLPSELPPFGAAASARSAAPRDTPVARRQRGTGTKRRARGAPARDAVGKHATVAQLRAGVVAYGCSLSLHCAERGDWHIRVTQLHPRNRSRTR